jgi:hypothetical protein
MMPHLGLAPHCQRGKQSAVYQKITPLYSLRGHGSPVMGDKIGSFGF